MKTKNILIMGGNRFFGKHLAQSLIDQGQKPVLFNRQNIEDGLGAQVERVKGDRDDYDSLREVAHSRKWDFVFDQVCFAAGQAKTAIALFEKQVGHYIVTSTQSVYDYGVNLSERAFDPHHYTYKQELDRSGDYGEAKRQMEAVFYQKCSFPVTAVRFPIVLGVDDYTKRLRWHFDRLKNGLGVYFPNLQARMGYVDSREAGQVLSQLMDVNWARPLNVASPEALSMKELLNLIETKVGRNFKVETQEGNDNRSPFGVKNDWFMNLSQMEKLGIKTTSLMKWLPKLLDYELKLIS